MQAIERPLSRTGQAGTFFRWIVLALIVIVQLDIQAILYAPSVLAAVIIKTLHISRAQFGVAISAANAVVMLCVALSSFLIDRFGLKRGFLCGLFVLGAGGTAVLLANSFTSLIAARAVQGVGIAIIYPVLAALIMAFFGPEERPYVNTAFAACAFLGTGAAFVATSELFDRLKGSWSLSLSIYGMVIFIVMLIWAFLGREGQSASHEGVPHSETSPASSGESNKRGSLSTAMRMRVAWLLAVGIFAVSWVYQMYFFFLPLFLHDSAGLSATEASRLGSILPLSGVAGVLLFGLLAKNTVLTKHLLWTSCSLVIVGSPCIFFGTNQVMKLGLVIAGFGLSGFLPVITTYMMALPRMTPALLAAMLVMINVAVYLAGFLSPTLVGWLSQTALGIRHTLALFSMVELLAIVMFLQLPTMTTITVDVGG